MNVNPEQLHTYKTLFPVRKGQTDLVHEILEIPKSKSGSNIWITVTEIEEGSFGVAGKPVSIRQLIPFFTSDRQQRIVKYSKWIKF